MNKSPNSVINDSEIFRRNVLSTAGLSLGLFFFVVIPVRYLISPTNLTYLGFFLLCALMLTMIPILIRRNVKTEICSLLLLLVFSIIGTLAGFSNGGIRAPATIVFIIMPIIGFFGGGKKGAYTALSLSFFCIVLLLIADRYQWVHPLDHIDKYPIYASFLYFAGAVVLFLIGAAYERSRIISEQIITQLSEASLQSAKMASIGEMSAGIAHEINNPLTIIVGLATTLHKDMNNPEKFNEKILKINKAGLRITKIVNSLKKISRNTIDKNQDKCLMINIINEVLSLVEVAIKETDVKINIECSSSQLILCNEIEIEQVLINLVQNALYAAKKSSEKWIKINIFDQGSDVIFQIQDSGTGVPKEVRQRLFDPFFTTKPAGEGTGLGLAISKRILNEHNATISINDSISTSCFEIKFSTL